MDEPPIVTSLPSLGSGKGVNKEIYKRKLKKKLLIGNQKLFSPVPALCKNHRFLLHSKKSGLFDKLKDSTKMGANKASGGDQAKITNKSSYLGRVLSKLTKQSRKQTTEVLPYSLSNQKTGENMDIKQKGILLPTAPKMTIIRLELKS